VRRSLASAAQGLTSEERWGLLASLLSHSEDATDHNLPHLYWYAMEPLAEVDAARALKLAADAKLPRRAIRSGLKRARQRGNQITAAIPPTPRQPSSNP
jgi:hypothetical protein